MTNSAKNNDHLNNDHYVVAYDFSELSDLALREAFASASERAATVHVLSVLDRAKDLTRFGIKGTATAESATKVQEAVERIVKRIAEPMKGVVLELFVHCRIGDTTEELVNLAYEVKADRIFVGTHGRTGAKRLILGSVAEALVRRAPCPVLVMRPTADYADNSEFAPEPVPSSPTPPKAPYESPIQPWRFSFTRDHQVVVKRNHNWPLG